MSIQIGQAIRDLPKPSPRPSIKPSINRCPVFRTGPGVDDAKHRSLGGLTRWHFRSSDRTRVTAPGLPEK